MDLEKNKESAINPYINELIDCVGRIFKIFSIESLWFLRKMNFKRIKKKVWSVSYSLVCVPHLSAPLYLSKHRLDLKRFQNRQHFIFENQKKIKWQKHLVNQYLRRDNYGGYGLSRSNNIYLSKPQR